MEACLKASRVFIAHEVWLHYSTVTCCTRTEDRISRAVFVYVCNSAVNLDHFVSLCLCLLLWLQLLQTMMNTVLMVGFCYNSVFLFRASFLSSPFLSPLFMSPFLPLLSLCLPVSSDPSPFSSLPFLPSYSLLSFHLPSHSCFTSLSFPFYFHVLLHSECRGEVGMGIGMLPVLQPLGNIWMF